MNDKEFLTRLRVLVQAAHDIWHAEQRINPLGYDKEIYERAMRLSFAEADIKRMLSQ